MATSKPTKKTTTTKKPLPKAQFGGSGVLGLPTFEERQKRKIDRATAKNAKAQAQGYDSLADKRTERSNRISKVLGTARSKVKSVFGNNNNVANTVDSYNKGSYNKGSFNNSSVDGMSGNSTYSRPQSIMQSQPTGFTSPDINSEPTSMIPNGKVEFTLGSMNKETGSRGYRKGGPVKKKTVTKKK
jgi:hypothetical protein